MPDAPVPAAPGQPKAEPGQPPPVPKGPVLDPPRKARHLHYVAHVTFHLPNGAKFDRGDILTGKDALAYELAVDTGESDANFATPPPADIHLL